MSSKPLAGIFEGKLRSAELLAKQKEIEFSVEDQTTAIEPDVSTMDHSTDVVYSLLNIYFAGYDNYNLNSKN